MDDLRIEHLPHEAEWSAWLGPLTLNDLDSTLQSFHAAMRTRDQSESAVVAARLQKELSPHLIDGRINLTPEIIEAKRSKIEKEVHQETFKARSDGQTLRVKAGILLRQAIAVAEEPPSWAGSVSPTAPQSDHMAARSLDITERKDAREWLATATPREAVDRFRAAPDGSDRGFVHVVHYGALPKISPDRNEDVAALQELVRLREARSRGRVQKELVDGVHGYNRALGLDPAHAAARTVIA